MTDKKKIDPNQPFDFFSMLSSGAGWGQFDLSAGGIHPVGNGSHQKEQKKNNVKRVEQPSQKMEYKAPVWEIPSMPMGTGLDMMGMMTMYKKPITEQNPSGKTNKVVINHTVENKMQGFDMPTMGDIDMRGLDEKIGSMFQAPKTAVDMSVIVHNRPDVSVNVPPSKKVVSTKPVKSSGGRPSAPVKMSGMGGGGMDMSKVPSGMMGGYGIPSMSGGIPTMGDVIKGHKGMDMPTLADLVQAQDKSQIHPLAMMHMGEITTPQNIGEGIVKAVKGIDDTIKNVNSSYRVIKSIPSYRSKINKGALGNPKEDEFHPDNVPTFKKGYDTYVVNPISGREQKLEDYIKEHNQYYLQGKTPSSQHTIGKDLTNRIKGYLARKQAEKQVENIQAFSNTLRGLREQKDNPNNIGDVVSQGNLSEFDNAYPSSSQNMESETGSGNKVEIGLPQQGDVFGFKDNSNDNSFDLTRDVMLPSQAMQNADTGKSLTDAPEPMDFSSTSTQTSIPIDESQMPPLVEPNPQGDKNATWCFYVRDSGRASVATGAGSGAGTVKCYTGFDLANNMKNRYRSMGFEVSGMFTKTRQDEG